MQPVLDAPLDVVHDLRRMCEINYHVGAQRDGTVVTEVTTGDQLQIGRPVHGIDDDATHPTLRPEDCHLGHGPTFRFCLLLGLRDLCA